MSTHPTIKPKTQSPLKYRLQEAYEQLPNGTSKEEVAEKLKGIGIARTRFFEDLKIKLEDKRTISEYHLQLYASAFGVTADWLVNYTVEAPSIINVEKKAKVLAKEFNLSK
ncbi:hypothetical protein [Roseivirga seohaensis]|uniref:hypothetical protein n=1 Tax=Roseivirga seohaensis TaxID=1914963 RepID=UPI003BAACC90